MGQCCYSIFASGRTSSGSLRTAVTQPMFEKNLWLDYLDEQVNVYIFGRRISLLVAFHHFIVCESPNLWRIAEWGAHNTNPLDMFCCEKIRGRECYALGTYSLREVYEAISRCSDGRIYEGTIYNCNHWSEQVSKLLGWGIKCNWNCFCNHRPEPLNVSSIQLSTESSSKTSDNQNILNYDNFTNDSDGSDVQLSSKEPKKDNEELLL